MRVHHEDCQANAILKKKTFVYLQTDGENFKIIEKKKETGEPHI